MKIWAAVYGQEGIPVLAVFGTRKADVAALMADRQANGEAFEGERLVWFANLDAYAARLAAHKLPRAASAVQADMWAGA